MPSLVLVCRRGVGGSLGQRLKDTRPLSSQCVLWIFLGARNDSSNFTQSEKIDDFPDRLVALLSKNAIAFPEI